MRVLQCTLSRLHLPADEERARSYIRENFEGLDEETLADFFAKNRERHPVEPDLNPEGRLTCLSDEVFRHIFRGGEGTVSARRSPNRTARSGSRGLDSTQR